MSNVPEYMSSPCKNYYEYSKMLKQFAQDQEIELENLKEENKHLKSTDSNKEISLMETELNKLREENKSLKETVKDLRRIKDNYAEDFSNLLTENNKLKNCTNDESTLKEKLAKAKDSIFEIIKKEFEKIEVGEKTSPICIRGRLFETVRIGHQIWTSEDLDISLVTEQMSNKLGLYTFEETKLVQKLCPRGWHIPNNSDWEELIEFASKESKKTASLKLRSTEGWENNGTNELGFNMKPSNIVVFNDTENSINSAIYWKSNTDNTSPAFLPFFSEEKIGCIRNYIKTNLCKIRLVKNL